MDKITDPFLLPQNSMKHKAPLALIIKTPYICRSSPTAEYKADQTPPVNKVSKKIKGKEEKWKNPHTNGNLCYFHIILLSSFLF